METQTPRVCRHKNSDNQAYAWTLELPLRVRRSFFFFFCLSRKADFSAPFFAPFPEEDILGCPAHGPFIRVLTGKLVEVGWGKHAIPIISLGISLIMPRQYSSTVSFPLVQFKRRMKPKWINRKKTIPQSRKTKPQRKTIWLELHIPAIPFDGPRQLMWLNLVRTWPERWGGSRRSRAQYKLCSYR